MVNDKTQNKLLDNELPVHVKKVTFLTNSAIDERIIDVHEHRMKHKIVSKYHCIP